MPEKLDRFYYRTVKKNCLYCGCELKLNNNRDVERKTFCNRSHSAYWNKDNRNFTNNKPHKEETKQKIKKSAKARENWKGDKNPNYKGKLKRGKRLSENQKEFLRKRMLDGGALVARKGNKRKSSIQIKVENYLTSIGISFIDEYRLNNRLVDIFIEPNIVIECDGNYWHSFPHIKLKDEKLNSFCRENNIEIIRLTETQIKQSEFIQILDKYFNGK